MQTDIFIIGGGINGTSLAADAAGRGLSVILCEKNDFASGTSSASTKLIHGGLRYLEFYEFRLVRQALQEREILLRRAPHLITPLEFILPHEKHLRPTWMIRAGLFLYDHLASHPLIPSSKKVIFSQEQPLKPEYKMGFSYYDCQTDDARLTVLNAISAREHQATLLTRTEFLSAEYRNKQWHVQLKNNLTGESYTCQASVLVNAGGPWVQAIQKKIVAAPPCSIELVKGSHIVVPQLYAEKHAYILQNSDGRIVFTIPYQEAFTLIGTTDLAYSQDLDTVTIDQSEIRYLCETVNHYFKKEITPDAVVWSYAGVRCLQANASMNPSAITRDYKLELANDLPLLTIIGGKITTHRHLAEDALKKLSVFFPEMKKAWTAGEPLPGGDFVEKNFADFYQAFCREFSWLPEKLALRYAKNYGTRARLFLKEARSLADLGETFSDDLYQTEVEYLIEQEWARTCDDILWRRTKLGLFFSDGQVNKLKDWLLNYF